MVRDERARDLTHLLYPIVLSIKLNYIFAVMLRNRTNEIIISSHLQEVRVEGGIPNDWNGIEGEWAGKRD
jgi:hypothetical protein